MAAHVHLFNNTYQRHFRGAVPRYEYQESGPQHEPYWQCSIYDSQDVLIGVGGGKNKKLAKDAAADSAIRFLYKTYYEGLSGDGEAHQRSEDVVHGSDSTHEDNAGGMATAVYNTSVPAEDPDTNKPLLDTAEASSDIRAEDEQPEEDLLKLPIKTHRPSSSAIAQLAQLKPAQYTGSGSGVLKNLNTLSFTASLGTSER
ncbi:uncharacterized protein LACBIDRAFT_321126 [Laccaria bicolor S238N-H82]|uniref:Predicted protein n=1 Tax=Laccaria bicolor (strain S238N-H82 / ATCC MYA-4686) TaxID=486041 RepID=B0CNV1_LACBS|nr:uncharacterized protein LACBIDRAFT_321126 [Laccaria bicolor S238N-H82]EDR16007.1 predicted protein [Laccaria bicolor S238N-H82]|eukprot:XP_001874215.1 predicted protein [Laccaria bicolor S238N-H82]